MVFFVAVLPQFVDHAAGAIPLQLAVLGATFLVIALVSDSAWALAAGRPVTGSPVRPAGSQRSAPPAE